jgi:poly(hydroxyalkanoate) depolymerase family esterase
MNPRIQAAIEQATLLTRAGRLHEATATLQQALRGSPAGSAPVPGAPQAERWQGVIDVEARVVEPQSVRPAARFEAGRCDHADGSRTFKLYRPAGRTPEGQAPALVVMLHGCTQDPDDFARGTAMNAHAEARGWWVLYPAQSREAHASGCWNWFQRGHQQRGRGEPAILSAMVSDCVQRHGLDPKRVFVAGMSAGGAMAVTLGATHPELYAGVGAHSALAHGSARDLPSALAAMRQGACGRPTPHRVATIVFHGDQDHTVHPCNGQAVLDQARALPSAAAPDDHAVETESAGVPGGHRYTRRVHRGADGGAEAEYWLVHGAGHAWSGGQATGSFTDPRGPDASAEMLRFFDALPRR